MIADLKADSRNWQKERKEARGYRGSLVPDPEAARDPDDVLVDYASSRTRHERQYYGGGGQQPSPMPPPVSMSQQGQLPPAFGYEQSYPYGQSVPAGYQQPAPAFNYPSPVHEGYELQGQRESRRQGYSSYSQAPAAAIPATSMPDLDAEAQGYYFATQGPMTTGGGQAFVQPRIEPTPYSQAPPRDSYMARESHSSRDDGARRPRRER